VSPRKKSFASALSTALNPPKVDAFGALGYSPACLPHLKGEFPEPCGNCAQEVFATATEDTVVMGGAAAGGKTLGVLMWAIRACVEHPGIRIGAFRRSYPELRDSLLAELGQRGYATDLGATFNQSEHELKLPNGSLIMFRYAETLKDATRRQGAQYQGLVLDELSLFDWDVVTFLQSRIRSGRADIPVLGTRATCNPGGPSHHKVKAILEKTNFGERTYEDEGGHSVRFVKAGLRDNPWIDSEYAARLQALPEKLRRAFLEGDWSSFEGAIFPELDEDRHRVRPMALPSSWRRYAGIDWGYRAPWAVIWAAESEEGRLYLYREIYETQVGESEQARRILEAEGDEQVTRLADSALWQTRGEAMSVAEAYQQAGCAISPAGKGPGSRVAGWARIREYLQEAPPCPHHRALGWSSCPLLHVFTTCENWWSEMTSLSHSITGNVEDSDPRAPDHIADATRYLISALGAGPSWPVFDAPPAEAGYLNVYGQEVLEQRGPFAFRRVDSCDEWTDPAESLARRIVRTTGNTGREGGY
jgi:PBSX family phage terminase large subunit